MRTKEISDLMPKDVAPWCREIVAKKDVAPWRREIVAKMVRDVYMETTPLPHGRMMTAGVGDRGAFVAFTSRTGHNEFLTTVTIDGSRTRVKFTTSLAEAKNWLEEEVAASL